MKIGYLTKQNPLDKKAYSGTHFYMYQALRHHFEEVIPYGPIDSRYKIVPQIKGRLLKLRSGKIYKYQYDTALARRMAKRIDAHIQSSLPDAVLASLMSPEVAHLNSKVPLYITTDATFPLLNEVYGSHQNLHPQSIKAATRLEGAAFEKATKLILPLQWLADSAMKDYGISANKIEVIPYGPNIDLELSMHEAERLIEQRTADKKLNLLFVGVRWEEKGGPFAVRVLQELLKKGIHAELKIVGCHPKLAEQPKEAKILGFLDKEKEEEARKLYQLYEEASFFIMPTQAECVGMSFIESAAFALPAIGTMTGGVPEAVLHQETGFLMGEGSTPEEVAAWVNSVFQDEAAYQSLSKNAYRQYKNRMNWQLWGERVREVIEGS